MFPKMLQHMSIEEVRELEYHGLYGGLIDSLSIRP